MSRPYRTYRADKRNVARQKPGTWRAAPRHRGADGAAVVGWVVPTAVGIRMPVTPEMADALNRAHHGDVE
jgi:hypothetical protein